MFQSSPVHGGRAHLHIKFPVKTHNKFQSSPVHGGRAHFQFLHLLRIISMFQSSPVHGGRAHRLIFCVYTLCNYVSILARPWRTGAPRQGRGKSKVFRGFNPRPSMADGRTISSRKTIGSARTFQSSPVHGGRAHLEEVYPAAAVKIVSILARPWRTGAPRLHPLLFQFLD